MKRLLSICIPTYNRPDRLKKLYQSFLRRVLDEYGDQIEVVVRDNSDEENARLNRASLGSTVRYYKNETNIGFGGSLIRLVSDAIGQFIWIISDDDLILYDGFKCLMDCLPYANDEGIDCLMLPINYRNNVGELTEYKNDRGERSDIDLETYVATLPTVPFGYFAASVIRLNKKRLDWVAREFHNNNILNIPLFLSMLKPSSQLRFLDTPVIEYKEADHWMNIFKFYTDLRDVILFLEKEYHGNRALLLDLAYKESLLMILTHRVGLRCFQNADAARMPLLAKLSQNLNIKTCILALLVALPRPFIRGPFLLYLSLQHVHKKGCLSISEVISRYRALRHLIQTKQNERKLIK